MLSVKDEAFKFLHSLHDALTELLQNPIAMTKAMLDLSATGASEHKIRENRFLYHFVFPQIFAQMQTMPGIGPKEARLSLLCEYHAKVSDISSGNSFRRAGYPFGKAMRSAEETMSTWTSDAKRTFPLNQAYPDFAIRAPFPDKIVFDAKYFDGNSEAAAAKALVDGVYEAAHYRGLPRVPAKSAGQPEWDYDFGCLLAYDASDEGILDAAWKAVRDKSAFWEGGNIFVMIIRGTSG
jgi:hypothetical protein